MVLAFEEQEFATAPYAIPFLGCFRVVWSSSTGKQTHRIHQGPGNRCRDHHAQHDLANNSVLGDPGEAEADAAEKHQLRPISPPAEKSREVLQRSRIVGFHPFGGSLIAQKTQATQEDPDNQHNEEPSGRNSA